MAAPPTNSLGVQVRDITNGFDLFELAPDTIEATTPASLVKGATTLVLYNLKGPAGQDVLTTETATLTTAHITAAGGSGIGLVNGDTATWHHWLEMLLHASDNAVAAMIADVIGNEIDGGGEATFVAEMNSLASSLGMTNTTFASPNGFPSQADRTTASDMAKLWAEVWTIDSGALRQYSENSLKTFTVDSGPSAGSIGPWNSPVDLMTDGPAGLASGATGIKDAGLLCAKGGFHTGPTPDTYSVICLWQSPAGDEVIVCCLHADRDGNRYADARACIYRMPDDFPYLVRGTSVGADADFSNVVLLATAASGSALDVSSLAHTITANGTAAVSADGKTVGDNSMVTVIAGNSDFEIADSTDFEMGSGDFTIEFYYAGTGAEPGGNQAFLSKFNTTGNQREWSVEYQVTANTIICAVSRDGVEFLFDAAFDLDAAGSPGIHPDVFFNGAKRHIVAQREGTDVSVWVNGEKCQVSQVLGVSDSLFAGTAEVHIGGRHVDRYMAGSFNEVRITKGIARYTGAPEKIAVDGRAYPRS